MTRVPDHFSCRGRWTITYLGARPSKPDPWRFRAGAERKRIRHAAMDNVDLATTFQRRFWCCNLAHSSGRSDRGGRSERDWSVETVATPTHWSAESWQWNKLLAEAQNSVDRHQHQISTADSMERRAVAGMQKKKLGEVPRARQRLTGAALALGRKTFIASCRIGDLKRCHSICHKR